MRPVSELYHLTPYGMLLVSLGLCTGIVLHTYAQNHGLNLEEVGLRLQYDRVFREDCENCEQIHRYEEQFEEEVALTGDLTEEERDRLEHIAHQCSVYKILRDGATVSSRVVDEIETSD
jgi:putative redox protein